jgi:hypothetical protein
MAKALLLWLTASVLFACGGGGSDHPAMSQDTPFEQQASIGRGTLLQSTWSAYPRLVRLAHQADAARNGRIVASLTENAGGIWQAGFHASQDDGVSFTRVGTLRDSEFAKGLCCGSLFEMPQQVGTLPAGTLLFSASIGLDAVGALMEQRIYRSNDAGATFTRIDGAACGRSAVARVPGAVGSGVWEPEFFIAANGSLACIFSDETDPGHSQVLKLTTTSDGSSWSTPRVIVAGPSASDRPGMAGVRRLPNGTYAMSFENCSVAHLDCSVRLKLSNDGLDWGALGTLGTRPQTAAGQYFRHTPTLAWLPTPGEANGTLVLIGQIVSNGAQGVDAANNGRVLFVNTTADGSGPWRMVSAPIALPSPPSTSNWCQNYSTPLLPSVDGHSVLLMQTDSTVDGGCNARYGRGVLAD